jgi:hypothetical protein
VVVFALGVEELSYIKNKKKGVEKEARTHTLNFDEETLLDANTIFRYKII